MVSVTKSSSPTIEVPSSRIDIAARDKRIFGTGCSSISGFPINVHEDPCLLDQAEQTKMNDCYFDKKDWRICGKEVRTCRTNSLSCGDSDDLANEENLEGVG